MAGVLRATLDDLAWDSDRGQGMTEYALIIALVALVVLGALALLGPHVASLFNSAGNSLSV